MVTDKTLMSSPNNAYRVTNAIKIENGKLSIILETIFGCWGKLV